MKLRKSRRPDQADGTVEKAAVIDGSVFAQEDRHEGRRVDGDRMIRRSQIGRPFSSYMSEWSDVAPGSLVAALRADKARNS